MTPRGLRDVVAPDAHHVVTKSQRGPELLRQPFRFRARGLLPLQALALHDERSRPPGHRPEEEQVLIGELKGRRRTHQRDPDEVFAMKQRDAVQGALRDLPQRLALDVRIGRPRHHRGFALGRDLPREAFADPQTEPAPQVLLEATGGDADDEVLAFAKHDLHNVDVAGRLRSTLRSLLRNPSTSGSSSAAAEIRSSARSVRSCAPLKRVTDSEIARSMAACSRGISADNGAGDISRAASSSRHSRSVLYSATISRML